MPAFAINEEDFAVLNGSVVVLTGGSSGIGAATAHKLYENHVHVVIGDVSIDQGAEVVRSCQSTHPDSRGSVQMVQCDVADYAAVYKLIRSAYDIYGRLDHIISCAGILERGAWFDPDLTPDSVANPDPAALSVIDVNLNGSLYVARIGIVFLRESVHKNGPGKIKPSLSLFSSIAGYRESPGLYLYQTSKHAIIGLLRSSRNIIGPRDSIRVNAICPGFTISGMTTHAVDSYREKNLPLQTAEDVARVVLGIQCKNDLTGEAVYAEGGKAWAVETQYWDNLASWIGEEGVQMIRASTQHLLGGGLVPGAAKPAT